MPGYWMMFSPNSSRRRSPTTSNQASATVRQRRRTRIVSFRNRRVSRHIGNPLYADRSSSPGQAPFPTPLPTVESPPARAAA